MYQHGVNVLEQPTPITAVKTAETALPFVTSIASGKDLPADKKLPVNELKLIFNFKEYVETFGWDGDTEKYPLEQFAYFYFRLYTATPVIFVNVFDPEIHKDDEGNPDSTKVTVADVIGGISALTGKRTGLELLSEVFPKFGKIVGQILCPGFSSNTSLYPLMIAKATKNNSFFKCMTYIDLRCETLSAVLDDKKMIDSPFAVVCTSPVLTGEIRAELGVHTAGIIAQLDVKNGGVPYESPSNKSLLITGVDKIFSIEEANTLNSQGIVTYFRFTGGYKLWGNRTSAYPGTTDIKDSFIANRRMANWLNNTLIIDTWNKVDDPLNKRLIDAITTKWNIFLNGQVGRGFLIGARIGFYEEDNPVTDLSDGIIKFRIDYLSPPPARNLQFIVTVDVNYFKNLF